MKNRKYFVTLLLLTLTLGMVSAFAQKQQQRRRPAARKTAKTQDSRVYLVHADVLHFDQRTGRER